MVYRQIRQSLTDLENLMSLLELEPEVKDRPDARPLALNGAEVRFDGVGFGYDPRRPVLHDVDFTVPAGHTLALVGSSGAGKSTVVRLLFRFYDVDEGAILIDGQDLRDVTQDSLRAAIGLVPQDTVLFNDTIRANIAYGRPGRVTGRDRGRGAGRPDPRFHRAPCRMATTPWSASAASSSRAARSSASRSRAWS